MSQELAKNLLKDFTHVEECPHSPQMREILSLVAENKVKQASQLLWKNNPFPHIALKLCAWERYFSSNSLESLEKVFSSIPAISTPKMKKKGKKVGIVGSGMCGITTSHYLAQKGYDVTVFEALPKPGGFLQYAVPDFVLPKDMLTQEIEKLEEMGVTFETNKVIGQCVQLSEVREKFDALLLAAGESHPNFIKLDGQHLPNVYYAHEYLCRINMLQAHRYPKFKTPLLDAKTTVVVGGGEMAIYCARMAKSLGNDVTMAYRRSVHEMNARSYDIEQAKEEGVKFLEMTQPVKIEGNGTVNCIKMVQMMLEAEDEMGKRSPVPLEDTEYSMPTDQVILAVGQVQNPILLRNTQLRTGFGNKLLTDDSMRTSEQGIFAAGDLVRPSNDIRSAIQDGGKAAFFMNEFLK